MILMNFPLKVVLSLYSNSIQFDFCFALSDWKEKVENEDEQQVNIWEDNWDDDNIEDDFSKQLKYVFA